MATLGFTRADFGVFKVEGFDDRMQQIYARVRPRLLRLGGELAPELARTLHMEFFPHVARHARRTVNPPPETWAAFGPSPRGYKRYGYLALCISGSGIHARAVVKSEADRRPEMARGIEKKAGALSRSFRAAPLARYDRWDFAQLPRREAISDEFWSEVAQRLTKKTGALDVGFGWSVDEALRVDRAEVLEAFRELEPLYRILRSAA